MSVACIVYKVMEVAWYTIHTPYHTFTITTDYAIPYTIYTIQMHTYITHYIHKIHSIYTIYYAHTTCIHTSVTHVI